MTDYRVYLLDRAGKIANATWISAAEPEEAIQLVREKHKGTACEIWVGAKCVATVPPN